MRSSRMWMRYSRMDRASDCQCQSCNSPGFDPSIFRHSGILIGGRWNSTVLNILHKKSEKNHPVFSWLFSPPEYGLGSQKLNDTDPDPGPWFCRTGFDSCLIWSAAGGAEEAAYSRSDWRPGVPRSPFQGKPTSLSSHCFPLFSRVLRDVISLTGCQGHQHEMLFLPLHPI